MANGEAEKGGGSQSGEIIRRRTVVLGKNLVH